MTLRRSRRIIAATLAALCLGSAATADCDFSTSAHRDALARPSSIEHIGVEIQNSRKWAKNSISILTSPGGLIQQRFKDNLKATVTVRYAGIGTCRYEARVRQNGDFTDHIQLDNQGQVIASLDVRLREGNVMNAVRFKLLLPKTRNGIHEVLATLILRRLGWIAPETFMVAGDINGARTEFLFQENSVKELLERNLRREGPILEGDEALLWNIPGFITFELETVSMARLINDNWAEKGEISTIMALDALRRLQPAYLVFADSVTDPRRRPKEVRMHPDPSTTTFEDYSALVLAMNGRHALRPHNRKYYWNSFIQAFEPIYYDGNVNFVEALETFAGNGRFEADRRYFLYHADPDALERHIQGIVALMEDPSFVEDFADRAGGDAGAAREFAKDGLAITLAHLEEFRRIRASLAAADGARPDFDIADATGRMLAAAERSGIDMSFFDFEGRDAEGNYLGDRVSPAGERMPLALSPAEMILVMSEGLYQGRRMTLLPEPLPEKDDRYRRLPLADGELLLAQGIDAEIDEEARSLTLTQTIPDAWALLRGATLDGWALHFAGAAQDPDLAQEQRFNEFGLTGCFNVYDTTFRDVSITARDGQCEDSVNLVSSRGHLARLSVERGFADAIDLDFARIEIDDLVVAQTGNDCFDVSTGHFLIARADLSGCGDKGISVGENSRLSADTVAVRNAAIGISSKDLSLADVRSFTAEETAVCAEAFQKKQEFGGGRLVIEAFDCEGTLQQDAASAIVLNGLTQ